MYLNIWCDVFGCRDVDCTGHLESVELNTGATAVGTLKVESRYRLTAARDSESVLVLAVHCLTPFEAECFTPAYEQEERLWTAEMHLGLRTV